MEKQNELTLLPMLLTVPQVAKKLGLSRTMVYVLINREGLPVVRFGRAVRISASGRWANLPEVNRQRLLWLLSHLLERQLEPGRAASKEDGDERDDSAE